MDTMTGTKLKEPENDTSTLRQKAKSAYRVRNGKLGGRPRSAGMKRVDWAKYRRFYVDGLSQENIARQLGVSARTFLRRKAEWERENEAW